MNEGLHPLRLGEILDRTAHIYRARFFAFFGIAVIPAATMFVFAAGLLSVITWTGANLKTGASGAGALAWVLLVLLIVLLVPATLGAIAIGEAAIADAAARSFLGHPITIRGAYKSAWSHGWRYIGLLLLQGLTIVLGPAVAFLVIFGILVATSVRGMATNDPSPIFGAIVFVLLLVVGAFAVWMLLRVCLAFPACVVEQTTAWNAVRRGTRLSLGTKRRILVLYILGLLLSQILAWAVAFPAMIAIAFIPGLQGQKHAQLVGVIMLIVSYGAVFAIRALTKPVYGIALTLFYFDQRIRKEGFDIEWMMQQAGMTVQRSPAEPAAVPEIAVGPSTLEAAVDRNVETIDLNAAAESSLKGTPEESNV